MIKNSGQMGRRVRGLVLSGLLAFAAFAPAVAEAMPITKNLTVNVVDICDNAGSNCASMGPTGDAFFATEVNKIWAQAGISVTFNFFGYFLSTTFSSINDAATNSFNNLYTGFGQIHAMNPYQDYLFLTHTVAGAYGEGYFGGNALVIAMDTVMAYNGGAGRLDTIAHEIGHNLGLVPTPSGATYPGHDSVSYNLMTDGSVRTPAASGSQISTDGLTGLDRIPTLDQYGLNEVAIARSSYLLQDVVAVPEPHVLMLVAVGLFGLGRSRRHSC